MADDQINTIISASTQQFQEGMRQASDAAKQAGEQIKGAFDKVAAAFGVGLTIDGIKSFVQGMAELGEQTQRTAAMLGLSNEQVTQLGGFAKITGTSIDDMAVGLERMSLNIQRSTRDAFNPAAQGLKVLGLNARELIGIPTDQYIEKLHNAVSQFNPSLNLTNSLQAIGLRNVAAWLPLLLTSQQRWGEMKDAIQEAQQGLAAAIPGMADTHEQLSLLSLSAQSFGARLFDVLKPAIDAVIGKMREWLNSMSESSIRGLMANIANVALNVVEVVGDVVLKVKSLIEQLSGSLDELKGKFAAAAGGAAGGAGIGTFLGGPAGGLLGAASGGIGGFLLGGGSGAPQSPKSIIDAAFGANAENEFNASIERMRTALQKFLSAPAGGAGGAEGGGAGGKKNANAIPMGGQQQVAARMAEYNNNISLMDKEYAQKAAHLEAEVKLGQITEQQKTQQLLAAIKTRENYELTQLDFEKNIGGLSVEQYQEIENKKKQISQKAAADREKIIDEEAKKEAEKWKSAADQMAGAFNSQLRGLLAGTENWGTAMKNIVSDMVLKIIEDFDKMAAEWIAKQAMMAAAKLALNVASGGLGGLIGLATGAYDIPRDTAAVVHKGEMVIPAHIAENLRAGMGARGAMAPSHFPAFAQSGNTDARQLSATFNYHGGQLAPDAIRQHIRTIANELNSHWQSNPSVRPRGW